jgi:DNA-binding CsgD family transcriptional regulator
MGTRNIPGPGGKPGGKPGGIGDPLPLRGRQPEWKRIIDLLHRAGRGQRSVLVIDGPGGSGRTRLLDELVHTARQEGRIVFERCGPMPLVDLRQLAWECEQLATRLTALPPGTATGPVVVAWDDAGGADPGWRDAGLLAAPATPILWALAPRTGEGLAVAGVLGAPQVLDIELRPLPAPAVVEVLADLLGAAPTTDLVRLAAVASGNPRALVDLVDGLRDEGLVEIAAGSARLTSMRLPERFSFRVRGRLARLSPQAKHLVRVASAAGRSVQVPELAGLLRETTAALLPTIEEALSSGLVASADDGLAFSHDLVRDVVAGTLPESIRAALRDEVDRARATGSIPGGQPPETPEAPEATPPPTPVGDQPAGWESLTDSERAIARLVSQALTNRQIATRVHLSPHTINYHLRQIYRKLDIKSRVQLANLAQAQEPDPPAASSAS